MKNTRDFRIEGGRELIQAAEARALYRWFFAGSRGINARRLERMLQNMRSDDYTVVRGRPTYSGRIAREMAHQEVQG